jgi:hypothetical protein
MNESIKTVAGNTPPSPPHVKVTGKTGRENTYKLGTLSGRQTKSQADM